MLDFSFVLVPLCRLITSALLSMIIIKLMLSLLEHDVREKTIIRKKILDIIKHVFRNKGMPLSIQGNSNVSNYK